MDVTCTNRISFLFDLTFHLLLTHGHTDAKSTIHSPIPIVSASCPFCNQTTCDIRNVYRTYIQSIEMAPLNDKDATNTSRLMTQLQETTKATLKLQKSLQPYIKVLREQDHPDPSNHGDSCGSNTIAPKSSEHSEAIAKTVVALTQATASYLKPHLLRTADRKIPLSSFARSTKVVTCPTTSSSLSLQQQKQQQQQIRSDLNHIRQLLKKVQECHKRKENSSAQPQPNETTKRRKCA